MRKTSLVIAVLLGAIVGSSGSAGLFAAAPAGEAPALQVSTKRHVVVLKVDEQETAFRRRPSFVVAVHNLQPWELPFRVTNIHATRILADGTATRVRVLGERGIAARERQRLRRQDFGAPLVDLLDTPWKAGYRDFDTLESLDVYDAPSAAPAMTEDPDTIRAEGQATLATLQGIFLRDRVLRPGEWHGGTIVLEVDEFPETATAAYVVTIEIDIETHEFRIEW